MRTQPKTPISIIEAIEDPNVFGAWFRDRSTWSAWIVVLKTLFGIPMDADELKVFQNHTGRTTPSPQGYFDASLIVGRRGGKSIVLATIAAFFAAFYDWRPYLVAGERAVIMVIAADRRQAGVIFGYLRRMLDIELLKGLVTRETTDLLELSNGVTVEIATASFRTLRGRTTVLALADELAFWNVDGVNPDSEIISALRPAQATIPNARLLKASSPYGRKGVLWTDFQKHFGDDNSPTLIWQADTRSMNPSVPASFVDAAYADDAASANAEYGAMFRSDVESYVDREVVEACVIEGRYELPPMQGVEYSAFADPSGGQSDSMTLAIGHREGENAILDAIREVKPPFSPEQVVKDFADLLRAYRLDSVVGDKFAGMWPAERFAAHGIKYEPSARPKSDLYRDLLPILNGRRAELLDNPKAVAQICSLERRSRSGGRDTIDSPPRQHEDIANAIAGVLTSLITPKQSIPCIVAVGLGALVRRSQPAVDDSESNYRLAAEAHARKELRSSDLTWFLAERARRARSAVTR